MNKNLVLLLFAASLMFGPNGSGAEKNPKAKLDALIGKVQGKLKDGQNTEKDLAEELKQFDALLAQYKDEKTDEVAQILLMKAMLYVQVFENTEKGLELLKQLKSDFPGTEQAKNADDVIADIQKQEEAKKIQRNLIAGAKFPDFEEKDIAGKPLSIANYKGKVVLLDFWATWCGPCVAELPNVLKTYEKYHAKGFEIIGISLDKEEQALTSFIKKRDMRWQQFFDGKGWGNKLAVKYGINSIPMTYLLDGEGKIVAMNLRGEELDAAVAKILPKI
jgi:peroxiredoxin